ncbi:hypothetical protein BESB_055880 [Besnoitia besnoiti]|uniref:Uncharacterized protein n=1 Tax=Besnoitia besnoiti TaxID=94643 RepID=A0A2A9MK09_BESBE|nr:hypothetical protein BESB_055880 [Besnoitia besnoiti]PFH35937.1 hypothetical protein BESB_055880 [Besnoitia besnoiti]
MDGDACLRASSPRFEASAIFNKQIEWHSSQPRFASPAAASLTEVSAQARDLAALSCVPPFRACTPSARGSAASVYEPGSQIRGAVASALAASPVFSNVAAVSPWSAPPRPRTSLRSAACASSHPASSSRLPSPALAASHRAALLTQHSPACSASSSSFSSPICVAGSALRASARKPRPSSCRMLSRQASTVASTAVLNTPDPSPAVHTPPSAIRGRECDSAESKRGLSRETAPAITAAKEPGGEPRPKRGEKETSLGDGAEPASKERHENNPRARSDFTQEKDGEGGARQSQRGRNSAGERRQRKSSPDLRLRDDAYTRDRFRAHANERLLHVSSRPALEPRSCEPSAAASLASLFQLQSVVSPLSKPAPAHPHPDSAFSSMHSSSPAGQAVCRSASFSPSLPLSHSPSPSLSASTQRFSSRSRCASLRPEAGADVSTPRRCAGDAAAAQRPSPPASRSVTTAEAEDIDETPASATRWKLSGLTNELHQSRPPPVVTLHARGPVSASHNRKRKGALAARNASTSLPRSSPQGKRASTLKPHPRNETPQTPSSAISCSLSLSETTSAARPLRIDARALKEATRPLAGRESAASETNLHSPDSRVKRLGFLFSACQTPRPARAAPGDPSAPRFPSLHDGIGPCDLGASPPEPSLPRLPGNSANVLLSRRPLPNAECGEAAVDAAATSLSLLASVSPREMPSFFAAAFPRIAGRATGEEGGKRVATPAGDGRDEAEEEAALASFCLVASEGERDKTHALDALNFAHCKLMPSTSQAGEAQQGMSQRREENATDTRREGGNKSKVCAEGEEPNRERWRGEEKQVLRRDEGDVWDTPNEKRFEQEKERTRARRHPLPLLISLSPRSRGTVKSEMRKWLSAKQKRRGEVPQRGNAKANQSENAERMPEAEEARKRELLELLDAETRDFTSNQLTQFYRDKLASFREERESCMEEVRKCRVVYTEVQSLREKLVSQDAELQLKREKAAEAERMLIEGRRLNLQLARQLDDLKSKRKAQLLVSVAEPAVEEVHLRPNEPPLRHFHFHTPSSSLSEPKKPTRSSPSLESPASGDEARDAPRRGGEAEEAAPPSRTQKGEEAKPRRNVSLSQQLPSPCAEARPSAEPAQTTRAMRQRVLGGGSAARAEEIRGSLRCPHERGRVVKVVYLPCEEVEPLVRRVRDLKERLQRQKENACVSFEAETA